MIANTLYAKYIAERRGLSVIENEHGFITYKLVGEECFIADMFIDEKVRAVGMGRAVLAQLEEIAEKAGCKYVSANVDIRTPGSTNCVVAAANVGFEIRAAQGDALLIVKNLGGQNG